ncbi:MAG: hypothetical protein IIW83_02490 [Clostridia bacterium]|nr:hypothetical protein [Clostridia bacterium]
MYIEIGKSAVDKFCNGNIKTAIKAGYFNEWTPERIKGAFNNGRGTEKDFARYMRDNKIYCYFVEV